MSGIDCLDFLYIGNDNDLEVLEMQLQEDEETDTYIEDAIIMATVKNAAGTTIATVSLTHQQDGDYLGILPSSTSLTEGEEYTIIYQASNYGYRVTKRAKAIVRTS